jgi:hypothetical protein
MKAWTSLTDTSVVKTYREVPALKNNVFRNFTGFLNLLSRNKFASLQNAIPACAKIVTLVVLMNHPVLRFFGGGLRCAPTIFR